MSNDLVFISDNIYALKHEYGVPLTLQYVTGEVRDVTTGKTTQTVVTTQIAKAIVMPMQVSMAFIRTLLQSKGLSVPNQTSQIIIDRSDVPATIGFELGKLKAQKDDRNLNIERIDVFDYAVILNVTNP
jgi:hypothetical protein